MGAGLERDIDGGAARGLAGLLQRHRLGMRPAAGLGPAAADDGVALHDHAADIGVGRGPAAAALAERDRRRHPALLVQIPNRLRPLSSSWNCALALALARLAGASIALLLRPDLGVGAGRRPAFDEDELRARRDVGPAVEPEGDHDADRDHDGEQGGDPLGARPAAPEQAQIGPEGAGRGGPGKGHGGKIVMPAPLRQPARRERSRSGVLDPEGDRHHLDAFDRPAVERRRAEAPAAERLPLGGAPESVAGRRQPLDRGDPAVRRRW